VLLSENCIQTVEFNDILLQTLPTKRPLELIDRSLVTNDGCRALIQDLGINASPAPGGRDMTQVGQGC
jgi:hypothetical protein